MHQEKIAEVIQEVKKVVVGQDKMINRLLIGLFTNGHILLEGVPGRLPRSFTWILIAFSLPQIYCLRT
jgi:hypothetical protein